MPRAIGDFLILQAIRAIGGTALAIRDEDMVDGMRDLGRHEGISAAPESGAALHGLRLLVADGLVKRDEVVVLFNTGGALKHLEILNGRNL